MIGVHVVSSMNDSRPYFFECSGNLTDRSALVYRLPDDVHDPPKSGPPYWDLQFRHDIARLDKNPSTCKRDNNGSELYDALG